MSNIYLKITTDKKWYTGKVEPETREFLSDTKDLGPQYEQKEQKEPGTPEVGR